MSDSIVIVAAARTPMAGFQGDFASLTAPNLGAVAIRAAVERSGLPADAVQEVVMGCVLPAGLGQAPARQAALQAGMPLSAGCVTVNKVCGSAMKATMIACDILVFVTIYFVTLVVVLGSFNPWMLVPILAWLGLYGAALRYFVPRMARQSR